MGTIQRAFTEPRVGFRARPAGRLGPWSNRALDIGTMDYFEIAVTFSTFHPSPLIDFSSFQFSEA